MKETLEEKTLKALRYAGEQGIHSFDLRSIGGLQAPARIWKLINKDGHDITTRVEKKNGSIGVRYFLNE